MIIPDKSGLRLSEVYLVNLVCLYRKISYKVSVVRSVCSFWLRFCMLKGKLWHDRVFRHLCNQRKKCFLPEVFLGITVLFWGLSAQSGLVSFVIVQNILFMSSDIKIGLHLLIQ